MNVKSTVIIMIKITKIAKIFQNMINPIDAEKYVNELKVCMRHFKEAMSEVRPLSEQELHWYKTIAEQFDKIRGIRLRSKEIKSRTRGVIS